VVWWGFFPGDYGLTEQYLHFLLLESSIYYLCLSEKHRTLLVTMYLTGTALPMVQKTQT